METAPSRIINYILEQKIVKNLYQSNQSHIHACSKFYTEIRFLPKDYYELTIYNFNEDYIILKVSYGDEIIEFNPEEITSSRELDISDFIEHIMSVFEISEIITKHPISMKGFYMEDINNFETKNESEIFDEYGNLLPDAMDHYKLVVDRTKGPMNKLKNILGPHNLIFDQDKEYFYKHFVVIPRDIDILISLNKAEFKNGRLNNLQLLLTEEDIEGAWEINQRLIDDTEQYGGFNNITKFIFEPKLGRTTEEKVIDCGFDIEHRSIKFPMLDGWEDEISNIFYLIYDDRIERRTARGKDISRDQFDKLLHSNVLKSIRIKYRNPAKPGYNHDPFEILDIVKSY